MKELARLALFSWVPFTLLIFAVLPPRRAVLVAYIAGWLFLPMTKIDLPGIPDLSKVTAASFGCIAAIFLFDFKTLIKFRPKWFDVPILLWCVFPAYTSVVMKLGMYDAVSNFAEQLGVWGFPYLIGRIYFNTFESFKEFGEALVIGAVVYLPFLWFEAWFSPQLHKMVYGSIQHDFAQTKRWGGFRPMVFMESGLALAMYMMSAALVGTWMWMKGTVKKVLNMPAGPVMIFLYITAIVGCKTTASIGFLLIGTMSLLWIQYLKKMPWFIAGLPILGLIAIPPTYIYVRSTQLVTSENLHNVLMHVSTEERLQSFDTRTAAEDMIVNKALTPISEDNGNYHDTLWGWGRWDPLDQYKRVPWRKYAPVYYKMKNGESKPVVHEMAPTDGLWMITIGQYGKAGLFALTLLILLPSLILWRRVPLRFWDHPVVAPAAAMSFLLILHMIDNLLNAMINPLFIMGLGGISALGPAVYKTMRRYGESAAAATLAIAGGLNPQANEQQQPGPRGFPVQPMGYPQNAGGGQGFPVIPGLRPGTFPQTGQPRTGRPR